ncbi:cytochrome P450 [Xylariales sp. PMI_506]|nr:cytochrome P450 [Xylariales sp. PMI_506]
MATNNITSQALSVGKTLDEFVARLHPVVGLVIILLTVGGLHNLLKTDPLAKFPVVGEGARSQRRKRFMSGDGKALYTEGYRKFSDRIFRITTGRPKDMLVLPAKYLPEIGKLPDDVVSFHASVVESMQQKYTRLEADFTMLPHTIKSSLTPALARLNTVIVDEVAETMRIEMPETTEWTEVNINSKLLRVVAMVSGRIFVGPELCRDERYLDAAINYTVDMMIAVYAITLIPSWLRPLLAPILPPVKKLNRRIKEADAFLRPVVAARREAAEEPGHQKPDDMLQWIMDSQQKFGEKNDEELARYQLSVSFAAIHTSTLVATNAFYTLAAMPELIPELREDVQQAIAQEGGVLSTIALQRMKKLDSFMREVLRCYPLAFGGVSRKVLKPFTLSTGETIPAGSNIEVATSCVHSDSAIFEQPEVFDPLRFYKLRKAKEEGITGAKAAEIVAHSQFVSVSRSSLTFGFGRHACPGRFFAANEIKMILSTALLHYEVKMPDGINKRHENITRAQAMVPDPKKTIMIRRLPVS